MVDSFASCCCRCYGEVQILIIACVTSEQMFHYNYRNLASLFVSVFLNMCSLMHIHAHSLLLMATPTRQWSPCIISRNRFLGHHFPKYRPIWMTLGTDLLLHGINLFLVLLCCGSLMRIKM